VGDALASATGFRSAQQLHEQLRRAGASVGLTTVYRQLQTLADRGIVDVLLSDDGEARYRACPTQEHHHHLVCRACGRAVEVAGVSVEEWAAAVRRCQTAAPSAGLATGYEEFVRVDFLDREDD
jgi:Fur family ferric uptake transcriptional regulator